MQLTNKNELKKINNLQFKNLYFIGIINFFPRDKRAYWFNMIHLKSFNVFLKLMRRLETV